MKIAAIALVPLVVLAAACPGGPPKERTTEGVGLTIYSAPAAPGAQQQVWNVSTQRWELPLPGYAIVKEWRMMKLAAGTNTIRFPDVAAKIDATTVLFTSLTDPAGTAVLEQNFEYDLVSADKLLQKHIDRPITIDLENGGKISGTLLSFDAAQIVLQSGPPGPLQIVQRPNNVRNIEFAALPGGLITRPTLVWQIEAKKEGEHLAKVAYQTGGITWNADYTAVVSPDEGSLDLAAWVTIRNQSGGSYRDAELKLVAGDVQRVGTQSDTDNRLFLGAAKSARLEEPGFVEKPFFEYHLYTLGRPTTLLDNSVKQIELFPQATGAPVRKTYLYYGGVGRQPYGGQPYFDRNYGLTSNRKVDVYVEFRNSKEQGLGLPLPAGRVRVNKRDEADGSLEFVGEDTIDHTPKDERVRLKLGSAFDIVAERKQTDFKVDTGARWLRETFEIRIRNHKDEAVAVIVKENLYRWANWTVEQKSHDFTKEDARTVHFPVGVPKDGETVVTYTVLYSW
jgi:hypothetical protein